MVHRCRLFTSSLFLAGMFMSVFAAALTRKLGRKVRTASGWLANTAPSCRSRSCHSWCPAVPPPHLLPTPLFPTQGCMFFASLCFMLGTGLNAGAHNLAMLVVGRVSLQHAARHQAAQLDCMHAFHVACGLP